MTGRRSRTLGLAAVAAAGALVVASAPAPVSGATTRVRATDNRSWSPKTKRVVKGTRVVWRNSTGQSHNVVSYRGRWNKSSSLPDGSKTSFKFRKRGNFRYRCTIHSRLDDGKCEGMCGKVKVS
ncbi:MAG: cupredoxin domain-containing protein [Actinomycetota bacterium]